MRAALYIALGFALGLGLGYLLWRETPITEVETIVEYRNRESDFDNLPPPTPPERVVIYRNRTDTVNVCLGLPPEFVRDTVYVPAPVAGDPSPPWHLPRRFDFLILPFVGGEPAVSVYRSRTDIITYDPETARRVDLTYAHPPPPRFRLHGAIGVWAVPTIAQGADASLTATLDRWTARVGYGPAWEDGSLRWAPSVRVEGRLF